MVSPQNFHISGVYIAGFTCPFSSFIFFRCTHSWSCNFKRKYMIFTPIVLQNLPRQPKRCIMTPSYVLQVFHTLTYSMFVSNLHTHLSSLSVDHKLSFPSSGALFWLFTCSLMYFIVLNCATELIDTLYCAISVQQSYMLLKLMYLAAVIRYFCFRFLVFLYNGS